MTPDNTLISNGSGSIGWHNAGFFIPNNVSEYKRKKLFGPISEKAAVVIEGDGRTDERRLGDLPDDLVPIIGCTYELRHLIKDWIRTGRRFVYWDRGYVARGGKAWLPTLGLCFYRWQVSGYQMTETNPKASPDRWKRLHQGIFPWRKGGKHIVIAAPSEAYARFHGLDGWLDRAVADAKATGRPVVVRQKDSKRPLYDGLQGAHCLVTHGSVAAVEAVIMGCPVYVDAGFSAAAPVGRTDRDFDNPVMPDRTAWLHSLANAQFNLPEILNGECWKWMART